MIGTRFYKSGYDRDEYRECAEWCNQTQEGHIEDMGDCYEVVPNPEPTEIELAWKEIEELKGLLRESDYKCLKFTDGALTEDEYAPIRVQRQEWRDRINELEEIISQSTE